ncbi:MAG: heavy-metal-associated domain-containing protein [Candidatus Eisenbacteria bacterium]
MKKVVFIPLAIVVLTLVAFATSNAYRVPTVDLTFVEVRPGNVETVSLTVNGMKCRGMSMTCAGQIEDIPGIVSLTTYVRTHTAIIEYDPTLTDVETIKAQICEPIVHEGKAYDVFSID